MSEAKRIRLALRRFSADDSHRQSLRVRRLQGLSGLVGLLLALAAGLTACRTGSLPPGELIIPTRAPTLPLATPSLPEGPASATPPAPPPAPTASPTASPTAAPLLRQLTEGGCCTGLFWSPSGDQVLYVDRPSPQSPAGFWGVSPDGGPPALYTDRLGLYSPDWQLLAYPQNGLTTVERVVDGTRWSVSNGGRIVQFSPGGDLLAWTAGQSGPPFDTALREVWVSQVDGSQARPAIQVYSGGLVGWFPDGRLLVSGRLTPDEDKSALWAVPLDGSPPAELLRAGRLRGVRISPEGGWLAYQVSFSEDQTENGLWLADLSTGERTRLELFGAYRWRREGGLLVIPLEPGLPSMRLWEVEASSGQAYPLTDPGVTPFKIANGDWAISPDGRQIAFVSASDHNIWVISLSR